MTHRTIRCLVSKPMNIVEAWNVVETDNLIRDLAQCVKRGMVLFEAISIDCRTPNMAPTVVGSLRLPAKISCALGKPPSSTSPTTTCLQSEPPPIWRTRETFYRSSREKVIGY
jgi:hypothetical protein